MNRGPELVQLHGRETWVSPVTEPMRDSVDLCVNCRKRYTCGLSRTLRELEARNQVHVLTTECDTWQPRDSNVS